MTPKKLKKILIGALAVLVIAASAGVFFANQRLTAIAEETARMSADIEVAKKKTAAYASAEQQIASLSYVGDLAEKVLPGSQEQSVVVAELSAFATRERLTVSGIEFVEQAKTTKTKSKDKDKKAAVPKGVEIVPVIVKLSNAPYEDLISFMETVEQNQRKMQITSINLKPDVDQRSVLSEVAVTLNLYVKAAEKKE